MRIGLLGRGVGDAAFLAQMGAEVLVVDSAPQEVMQPSVDALSEYPNISFKFGAYDTADFTNCDFVLVGAGTPLNSPELAAARAAGVPLKQSAAWFAELAKVPVIGVTGTRGKSTVTHMIHHVLSEVTGETILLGGNVRGISNLQLLNEVKEDSLCVMELDSWQLQGWGWAKMSPLVSVFTTLCPTTSTTIKLVVSRLPQRWSYTSPTKRISSATKKTVECLSRYPRYLSEPKKCPG